MTQVKFYRNLLEPASFLRFSIATALVLWLTVSCAIIPRPVRSVHVDEDTAPGRCADFFHDIDARVARAAGMGIHVVRPQALSTVGDVLVAASHSKGHPLNRGRE